MKNLALLSFLVLLPLPIVESFNRELAFLFMGIGGILIFIPQLDKPLKIGLIELIFLLFLIIAAFSTVTSISIGKSFQEFLRYLVYFIIFVSISSNANLQIQAQKYLFISAIFGSIVLSIITLFFLSGIPSNMGISPPSSGMNLFYPTFGHNRLSNILIFSIPMASALLISSTTKTHQLFLTIITSFLMIMLILTSGRGAMLSLALALIVVYLLTYKKFKNKEYQNIWSSITLGLGVSTIIILLLSFFFSNLQFLGKGVGEYKGLYKPVIFEQRFEFYQQAIEGFSRLPLFGSGLDTFRYISKQLQIQPNYWSWYAHNHFLQLIAETGFIGGLIFLIFILFLFKFLYKSVALTVDIMKWGIFTAIFASTLHSLIDFDWQFYSIFLYFWIAMAVLMPKKRLNKVWLKPRTLILLTILLLAAQVFFNKDSDKVMTKADSLIQENKNSQALIILNRAYRLDPSYDELPKKIGSLYQESGNFDTAHQWYHQAIVLHPLGSVDYIKKDFYLYLDQVKISLEESKNEEAGRYLDQTYFYYPLFHQIVGGYEFYKDTKASEINISMLQQYTSLIIAKIEDYQLKPDEINSIVNNLQTNEKI